MSVRDKFALLRRASRVWAVASIHGEAERLDDEKGVTLRAVQPTRVVALGIETHLAASETARFSGLSQVRPVTAADPD